MDYSLSQRSHSPSYRQVDNLSQTSNNLSIKPLQLLCNQHHDEPTNNYCVQPKCYQPLCSECIEEHLLHHKKCGFSDLGVRSMRGVRKECIVKLNLLIQELMKRLQYLPEPPNSQKMYDMIIMKLDEAKREAHQILEEQFAKIGQSMLVKIKESSNILQTMSDIHQKLEGLIQQLRQNLLTISQGKRQKFTVPECIRTTLTLNEKALIDTFSKESLIYETNRKKAQFDVSFNPNILKAAIHQSIIISTQKVSNSIKEINSFNPSMTNKYKQSLYAEESFQEENKTIYLPARAEVIQYSKYLHFFETGSNKLHLIQIQNRKVLESRVISIDEFIVPSYYASLISHLGDVVFLSGGSVGLNNKSKSPLFIKYMIRNKMMKKDFARVIPRSSHSLCQDKNGDVYILGGYGQPDEQLTSEPVTKVEKISEKTGKVEIQAQSNWGGSNISFRYKQFILKACQEGVQLYTPKSRQWLIVETKINFKNDYILHKSSGYANLSDGDFLIFGGYSGSEILPTNECYHWKLTIDNGVPIIHIQQLNCKLPEAQGFDNGKALIDQKGFLVLQNVNDDQQEETCIDNERLLLRFDLKEGSGEWKVLQKIVQE